MGLTVHYRLDSNAASPSAALRLIEKLHRRAGELSFSKVGPVEPVVTDPAEDKWPAGLQMVQRGEEWHDVLPRRGWYFRVFPGPGSENPNFGLAEYPKTIVLPNGRRAGTKLTGWCWRDFCKTQYASNPRHGGVENFLRCHLALVDLLDYAQEIGLHTEVHDESNYAVHRDVEALRREVGRWNELVAGMVGVLKDALPGESVAPITDFPNFERLEAGGRQVEE